jgi:hypothetical protein
MQEFHGREEGRLASPEIIRLKYGIREDGPLAPRKRHVLLTKLSELMDQGLIQPAVPAFVSQDFKGVL